MYPSVCCTGAGVGDERVPDFLGTLGGHVESPVLEEEGHELEVDIHTLREGRKEGEREEEDKE